MKRMYELNQLRGAFMAGKEKAESEMERDELSFLGMYIHTKDENSNIVFQGKVKSGNSADGYSVQLFSWLDGLPTTVKIMSEEQLKLCDIYKDKQQWIHAGDAVFA